MNFNQHSIRLSVCLGLLLFGSNAMALTPAQEGRKVFLSQNCYGCHGGRGGGGIPMKWVSAITEIRNTGV